MLKEHGMYDSNYSDCNEGEAYGIQWAKHGDREQTAEIGKFYASLDNVFKITAKFEKERHES